MRRFQLWAAVAVLLIGVSLRIVGLADYPTGPHYDEAANVIIARTVAFGGARPFPMVENFQGREVLYYYVAAPLLMTVHDSRFALQLVGVYSNTLLIAATMALGWRMFRTRDRWLIGLFAGGMAAVSVPQILLARQAFRSITLPTMQALALLFLWIGLQQRRGWAWLITAGLFAGGTVYTYNSSRLFPVWLGLAGLVLLISASRERVRRLQQGLVFFGVLIVVALPFAVYGFQQPDIFLGRLYEVTDNPNAVTLTESIILHLRMFFLHGETLLRYNPTGRPYFTLVEGMALMIGWSVALWGLIRRNTPSLQRAGFALLVLSPMMILPSVIATGGLPPNHMRSIAMLPLMFIVGGVGFAQLRRIIPRERVLVGVWLALLIVGAIHSQRVYVDWASRADLYYDTDADLAAAAQWLTDTATDDAPVYVAARDRFHPTVTVFDTPPVRWLGTDTLFIPAQGERLAVFPHSAPIPDDWQTWLEPFRVDDADLPQAPDARAAFTAVRLPDSMPLPDNLTSPDDTVHTPNLTLVGQWTGGAYPNGRVTVTSAWQIDTPPTADDLTPIVQVVDVLGNVIIRAESFSVGTTAWEAGETLLQRVPNLRVPIGTPPDVYRVQLAWVAKSTDDYQPLQVNRDFGGVWADVGTLEVLRSQTFPPADELSMDTRTDTEVADGVRLLGWDTVAGDVRPGEALDVTLYWQATPHENRANVGYDMRLDDAVLDIDAPLLTAQPSSAWIDGQLMTERLRVPIPRTQENGDATLTLQINGQTFTLGTVTVNGQPRQMQAPTDDDLTALDMALDDGLRLYGYALTVRDDALNVTLVWRSDAPTRTDYTVFVHLLDANGNIIDQRDQQPQTNTYPTSLWVAGEYVTDSITFPTHTAAASVRVGLYRAQDGQRLPFANGEDAHIIPMR